MSKFSVCWLHCSLKLFKFPMHGDIAVQNRYRKKILQGITEWWTH